MSDEEDDGWGALAWLAIPMMIAGLVWEAVSWPFRKLKRLVRKQTAR